jgi:hypothetical protein
MFFVSVGRGVNQKKSIYREKRAMLSNNYGIL